MCPLNYNIYEVFLFLIVFSIQDRCSIDFSMTTFHNLRNLLEKLRLVAHCQDFFSVLGRGPGAFLIGKFSGIKSLHWEHILKIEGIKSRNFRLTK